MFTFNKLNEEEKQDVIRTLRTAEQGLRIVFTKKDGTQRAMQCTLNQKRIPVEKQPKSLEETTDSTSVPAAIRVFDLEKLEWRSFRWDSLISIS